MATTPKKQLRELLRDKRFLLSLPILCIALLSVLYFGGTSTRHSTGHAADTSRTGLASVPVSRTGITGESTPGESTPGASTPGASTPGAMNTRIPMAMVDTSARPKLDLQQSGPGTGPSGPNGTAAGGLQTGVPGSVKPYLYRSPGDRTSGNRALAGLDTVYQPVPARAGAVAPARIPARLRAGSTAPRPGTGPSFADELAESDAGAIPADQSDRLRQQLQQRQRLLQLLNEYKSEREAVGLAEQDKRKVRRAAAPATVGSLGGTDRPRNGFFGLYNEASAGQPSGLEDEVGTIRAVIHQDQEITSGGRVKLRLLDPVVVRGVTIPRNALIYGVCQLENQRVQITITSLQYENRIYPADITVFDMDGMPGLFVPNLPGLDQVRRSAGQAVSGVNITTGTGIGNVATAAGNSAAQASINGVRQYVQRKAQQPKARLKANYCVLLQSADQQQSAGSTLNTAQKPGGLARLR